MGLALFAHGLLDTDLDTPGPKVPYKQISGRESYWGNHVTTS